MAPIQPRSRPKLPGKRPDSADDVEEILQHWKVSGRALAQRFKVVATSLDMLVRASRKGNTSARYVSGRLRDLWQGAEDRVLLLGATDLWMSKKEALVAEADKGRWILQAHTAGLRALTIRDEAVADDLERLGLALGALKPEVDLVSTFRDWLWEGGAEGFDLELEESPVGALDAIPDETDVDAPIVEPWAPAAETWNDLRERAAAECDAETITREYRAPVERFARTAASLKVDAASPEADALRAGTLALDAWPILELDAVLEREELRSLVDPVRLAGRLLALIELSDRADRRLLDALTKLRKSRDPFASALLGAVQGQALGRAIGDKLDLREFDLELLGEFLTGVDAATGAGVLNQLVRRGGGEGAALSAILVLIARWGIGDFLRRVDPTVVPAPVGAALTRALAESATPVAFVREFLSRVPPGTAATALVAVPTFLQPMRDLCRTLVAQHPRECASLVKKLLEGDGAELVATALLTSQGAGWPEKLLQYSLGILVTRPRSDVLVAQLARERAAEPPVRLLALDALRQRPELLAEAVKWRPADVMEPSEIRERLQELRRGAKS